MRLFADVQEGPPTNDQLNSILEYIGPSKVGSVVKDASRLGEKDECDKQLANVRNTGADPYQWLKEFERG